MKHTCSLATAVLTVALASAACGGSDGRPTASVESGATTSAPVTATSLAPTTTAPVTSAAPRSSTTVPAPAAAPPSTGPSRLSASSRLRIDGLGPIDVGMTVAQARAAAGVELSLKDEPYCDVLTAPGGPAGAAFVVTAPTTGRIELIIVNGGPVATVSGIRVGSTEADVQAAYPGRLRSVNPSLPVHRLIYQADDPSLADRILVFVIDNSRVATMYAGVRDQAEADEICG